MIPTPSRIAATLIVATSCTVAPALLSACPSLRTLATRVTALFAPAALLAGLLSPSLTHGQTMTNGGFELPDFTPTTPTFHVINASTVPGWQTTATDNMIEIWDSGFLSVPAHTGDQFAELNANQVSTLFQDVAGIPGNTLIGFEFAHRARGNGSEQIQAVLTDLGIDGILGGGDDTVLFSGPFTDDNTGWGFYQNTTYLMSLGNTVRFQFDSVIPTGSSGNFLDSVNFGVGIGFVPEPSRAVLLGIGTLALLLRRRR